jgi:hypothetical protein
VALGRNHQGLKSSQPGPTCPLDGNYPMPGVLIHRSCTVRLAVGVQVPSTLAAVFGALASMHSFAQIQRTLLKSAGVYVKQWRYDRVGGPRPGRGTGSARAGRPRVSRTRCGWVRSAISLEE